MIEKVKHEIKKSRGIIQNIAIVCFIIVNTFFLYFLPPIIARNIVFFYYIPVAYATFAIGRKEGLAVVFVCSACYLPFVWLHLPDPLFSSIRYDISAMFHISVLTSLPFIFDYFAKNLKKEKERYKNLSIELDKKVDHLMALHKIQREISSALSQDIIQERIMDALIKILNAEASSIWLIDNENQELYCTKAWGIEKDKIKNVRLKLGEGISGWVAKFGIPQKVDNLLSDPRYKNPLGRENILRSQLSAPLRIKDNIIGVLNVFNKKEGIFTDDDLIILTLLAGQAAISIENARLYDNLSQKLTEISALLEISKIMILTTDLDDLLNFIMDSSINLLHADSGSLMLIDEKSATLKIKIIKGMKSGFDKESFSVNIGEGISGLVASEGNPMIVHKGDPLLEGKKKIYKGDVFSCISVPLKIKNMVIGVLNLNSEREDFKFSNQDIDILSAIASLASLAIEKSRLYEELINTNLRTIQALAYAIDAKDSYTAGHGQRTIEYAIKIARYMNMSEYEIKLLEYAASLHDIGKLGIPDSVLKKPQQLSEDEFEYIKEHVKIGANIIAPVEFLKEVTPLIFYHHERYDGHGYPEGLKGEEIPLGARILSVVDAYEAMTSDRPYRKALSQDRAIEELLRCAGTQFDPQIVEIFINILKKSRDD